MVFLQAVQPQPPPPPPPPDPLTIRKLMIVASVAAGVQFGWALQLSLLTPYTQLLGLSHESASFIWLCGPISGLVVQPIVGHYSDRCTSSFGRRRPFIVAGTVLLSIGVLLIGFAADIGRNLGDSIEGGAFREKSVIVFVVGFWLLDIANNMIQSPCRALLADLSGGNDATVTIGNALFASFMAVGNILGYAAGSYENLYLLLPFTKTQACDENCANIKSCFLFSILLTMLIITCVVICVEEETLDPDYLQYLDESYHNEEEPPSFFMQIVIAVRSTTKEIRILYIVTALNWIGLFPFLLYDTDWMGKEVYGGNPVGNTEQLNLYYHGVRAGALGLMVYVVTMGCVSLFMETFIRVLGNVRRLWSAGNFILSFCMAFAMVITAMAESDRRTTAAAAAGTSQVLPPIEVRASCLALFALLGIPQAITFSIPFALASIFSKDSITGQGLALGLLNLAIVIPQMVVALLSGPLDSVFGEGNLPAFAFGGFAAAVGGVCALGLPLAV